MLSVNQLTFKVKNKTLIDELTLNVTPGSFYALHWQKGQVRQHFFVFVLVF